MTMFKIKMHNLIFSLVTVVFVFSCQSTKFVHNEQFRQKHAKAILNKNYLGTPVARLENDPKLSLYMEEYLKKTRLQSVSQDVVKTLLETSQLNQYDPIFLMAVIKTESQFRPHVIGGAGEIGLMQIKPDTAEWTCRKKGFEWKGKEALKDPKYNIQVGALYFKYLKKSLNYNVNHYIAAYNSGPTGLRRLPAASVQKHPYLSKVLTNYLKIYSELEKIKIKKQQST